MKTRIGLAVFLAIAIGACAYRPVVDPKRSDMARYESDLAECRSIAEKAPGAGTGAAVGAVGGYAVGQVLARTTGNSNRANQTGRGAAVHGAASGAGAGAKSKNQIIKNCMSGRGHAVLD
jgi:outer membrane lipoprotein SlyB